MPSLFILGATGYIGGAVLFTLLEEIPNITATALVRDEKHVETLSKFGVATVVKAGQDLELVKQLASKSDIVLNAADADDEALTDAVLAGCKLHFENTGAKTLLIHTSGTAVLADEAEGVFSATATVYDDRDIEPFKTISLAAEHRIVDLKVVHADEAGYVSAYIICPSPLYGKTPSPIPRPTIVAKAMIQMSKAINGVPTSGDGGNVFNWTHVKDVASAFVITIKHALSGKDKGVGFEKYYLVAGPEAPWGSIAKVLGNSFQKRGVLESSQTSVLTAAKMISLSGRNARAFPGRVTQLGWRVTQRSVFEELDADIEEALKS